MSHFSLLVVGDDAEDQIGPYHEFECTGRDDQYVQNIDQTEECRADYESHMETRYKDTEGNLHNRFTPEGEWDERFVREFTQAELDKECNGEARGPMGSGGNGDLSWSSKDWGDGRGYRAKVTDVLPEGWTEVEVPTNAVESFEKFVLDNYGKEPLEFGEEPHPEDHKYGWAQLNQAGEVTQVIDRTNPAKKWDWFQIGGRWQGFFKLKPGAIGVIGASGIQDMDAHYKPPTPDRADVCCKGDIDIEGMRDEAGEKAAERYDIFLNVTAGTPIHLSWDEVRNLNRSLPPAKYNEEGIDYGKSRDQYGEQPAIKALRTNQTTVWYNADDFLVSREEYIESARNYALCTFAVVKDGKWYERGEMGWWGVVSDEQDREEWALQFRNLLDDLADNTLLSVVDCHI